ncbi:MAG: hypothetical protein ACE5FM_01435, partial [Methyloligellaceae bacterium]
TAINSVLTKNKAVLAYLISQRARFENWLQIETFKLLQESTNFIVELEYGYHNSQSRCDLWLSDGQTQAQWVEIKLCVTNYEKSKTNKKSARPITNQISDIRADIEKLETLAPSTALKTLIVVAYPLPEHFADHPQWQDHMSSLRQHCPAISLYQSHEISLMRQSTYLAIYVANFS